ncbi:Gifsy-2 prophage protein [Pseudomonas chlororaphis]|uniref:SOS response-associated peptidase family protein n=1 Tax=Pseudomonas chlororaphis TaxID=587753 RepID=UPI000F5749C2|nr:SOS response-associated peptidase family protein [Pseudomonas chlororaphis]AZD07586.1 Gifsy-2 prophage protein [Pseudomonas chlororaphis]
MCGRIAQYRYIDDYCDVLGLDGKWLSSIENKPLDRYNVPPTTMVALLHQAEDGLHADLVRWGWRPHWAKDRAPPINARVEKVAHGPFFRAIWPRRAITPIDGWFEWVDEGGPRKQPYFIRRKDGEPCLCASIGQLPDPDDGHGEHDGFVIITADAQGGMVDIHDRRPVVLSTDLAREWLDLTTSLERAEQMVLQQCEPSEAFEWFKVDRAVGNSRNQGAHLIAPISA